MSNKKKAKKLLKRVELWQTRLFYLGIGHFQGTLLLVDQTEGGPGALATTHVHPQYAEVVFEFTHAFLEEPQERQDEIIIHEWLHVAWRDFDRLTEDLERWMPKATFEDYTERLTHEREGLVDSTARTLLDLYNTEVVG